MAGSVAAYPEGGLHSDVFMVAAEGTGQVDAQEGEWAHLDFEGEA